MPTEFKGKSVLFVRGVDVLDPVKGDAIIEQMLDWLEAQGVKFAPDRKIRSRRKRAGMNTPTRRGA